MPLAEEEQWTVRTYRIAVGVGREGQELEPGGDGDHADRAASDNPPEAVGTPITIDPVSQDLGGEWGDHDECGQDVPGLHTEAVLFEDGRGDGLVQSRYREPGADE